MVVVPQINLKKQWESIIKKLPNHSNIEVVVINTCIKHAYSVNLLIIDEIHTVASKNFITVFDRVGCNMILGLTGTLKRLDGLETRILEKVGIVDTITFQEALSNGWVNDYQEFKVLVDVDLTQYNKDNRDFIDAFATFGNDFTLANNCARHWRTRTQFCELTNMDTKVVTAKAYTFSRCMKKRKDFVYKHKKKTELANYIISKLSDRKIITFSMSQEIAESITGVAYHSKMKKKEREKVIEDFNNQKTGVLNTVSAANAGVDIEGLTCAIFIGSNSSNIAYQQRFGRAARKQLSGEKTLVIHIILRGTVEEQWYYKSHQYSEEALVMKECDLMNFLDGKPYDVYQDENLQPLYYS